MSRETVTRIACDVCSIVRSVGNDAWYGKWQTVPTMLKNLDICDQCWKVIEEAEQLGIIKVNKELK